MLRRKAPLLIVGVLASPASAQLLLYDGFNYGAAGDQISTADGAGGWLKVPTSPDTTEPTIRDLSLTYTTHTLPWTPAGTSVNVLGTGGGTLASSTRAIPGQPSYAVDNGTLYYSMLFKVDNMLGTATGAGSFIAGFRNNTSTSGLAAAEAGAPLLIRQSGAGSGKYNLGIGITQESGDRMWDTVEHTTSETLLVVGSYTFVNGGDHIAKLWIDPDPALSEAANAAALRVTAGPTTTTRKGIRDDRITNFFLRNNGSAPELSAIDELRISSSWDGLWTTVVPGVWQGGNGSWSTAAMWSGGVVPNTPTTLVHIDNGNATNSIVTLDQNASVRSVAMTSGDALHITSGNTLTLAATSALNGVVVNEGTLNAQIISMTGSSAQLHWMSGTVTATKIDLNSNAQIVMSPGGDKLLKVDGTSAVSVSTNAKVDVADNKMIFTAGDLGAWNGTSYTGVTRLAQFGRNEGTWDGAGLITSIAAADTGLTGLAVTKADDIARVGTTFGGVTLQSGDVMVMYTYDGDADLSGAIDGDDFAAIDSGFSGTLTGYHNGDFNYSGNIDADDYWIIDANYNRQESPFPTAAPVAGVTAVPEPRVAAMLGLAALAHLRRRRKH